MEEGHSLKQTLQGRIKILHIVESVPMIFVENIDVSHHLLDILCDTFSVSEIPGYLSAYIRIS